MLTAQQYLVSAPERRPLRSLRQQYDLYVLEKIEQYKSLLSYNELMRLADQAMLTLREEKDEGQFLLTELLAREAVDEEVRRRLKIRSFESWRKYFPKLRAAQREPTHWGLPVDHIISALAPRLEQDDPVLVVGGGAETCAYLIAAHDTAVTFLASDLKVVERVERRFADESLSSHSFDAACIQFGEWLPEVSGEYVLTVIDSGTLSALSPNHRRTLISELQGLTAPGGLHILITDQNGAGPEGFASHYSTWQREALPHPGRRTRSTGSRGAIFLKPLEQSNLDSPALMAL